MSETPSLCFIIACKVYKNYHSYLKLYVSNIKEFYPSAYTILVDNNSSFKDIFKEFEGLENVIVIENTSTSKFEVGAYKFATEYIKNNNLKYDYYICTQDTFVLINKYDFNNLVKDKVKACPISHFYFHRSFNLHVNVLTKLNLYDPNEEFLCCWCTSWCCNYDTLLKIYDLLYDVVTTTRTHSIESERYMGKILKMFNNNKPYAIEYGVEGNGDYDCHSIDIFSENNKKLNHFFIKRAQQKNELTPE